MASLEKPRAAIAARDHRHILFSTALTKAKLYGSGKIFRMGPDVSPDSGAHRKAEASPYEDGQCRERKARRVNLLLAMIKTLAASHHCQDVFDFSYGILSKDYLSGST